MIKKITSVWIWILIGTTWSSAQNEKLHNVIQEIEWNTNYTFNYDVDAISTFEVESFEFATYAEDEIYSFFNGTPLEISIEQSIIFILPLKSSSLKICGVVFSKEDGEVLPFATIKIDNWSGIVTDENGFFESEISSYKKQYCEVSYVGKEPSKILIDSLKSCPEIFLQNSLKSSHSILIRSYILHGIQEGSSFGGVNLNLNLPSDNHLMRKSGIFHSIQLIPGISSPDDSALGLNIRGGSADHNLILWEGAPIYGQGYLYGMISPINPYSVDNVTVYKSNHQASQDNRIGGVVDMKLPDEIPEKLEMSIGANTTESHFNISAPAFNGKSGLFFSARKSMFSILGENNPTYESLFKKVFNTENALEEENEEIEEQDPSLDFYDINAKGIFQFSDRLSLHSSYLLSKSNSSNLSVFSETESQGKDTQSSNNRVFTSELKYKIDKLSKFRLIGRSSYYKKEAEFDFSENQNTTLLLENEESNSISDFQMEAVYEKTIDKISTHIGYVLDKKSTTLEIEQESTQLEEISSKSSVSKTLHHLYAQATYATQRFVLEGGNRISLDPIGKKIYTSPSLSTRVKIFNGLYYKLSTGWYHQFIKQIYKPVDADLIIEEPVWTLNEDVNDPVLNSAKLATGLIFKKKGWLIDIEGYVHDTRGLSVENPNIRNVISSEDGNRITSKGVDVLINKRINKFNTSLYYSWADNKISVPSLEDDDNESFLSNNDQTHIFRATQNYSIKNISFGLSYIYKTGLPYTSDSKIVYSDDDFYELEHIAINNARLSDYHRLDMTVSGKFIWQKKQIELSVGFLNITNRKNIGSRKSIINPSSTSEEPQLIEINKNLLPRTLQISGRIFF